MFGYREIKPKNVMRMIEKAPINLVKQGRDSKQHNAVMNLNKKAKKNKNGKKTW